MVYCILYLCVTTATNLVINVPIAIQNRNTKNDKEKTKKEGLKCFNDKGDKMRKNKDNLT